MSLTMAVFTFIVSWWVVLFAALPMGIETAKTHNAVEYAAAPKKIRWGKVLLLTTVMAATVTGLIAFLIHSGWISLKPTEF